MFNEAGISDPLLSIGNIRRLPLKFVTELALKTTKAIKQRRNAEALATANLGTLLHSIGVSFGEGGENVTPLTPRNFLPYPEEVAEIAPPLKPRTLIILKWLKDNSAIGKVITPLISKYAR